ncbi:hypothetical protein A3K64_02585 [Candidatus Micrarchaeota archaeon RBG_16_36_9]|nr:MAG: hypothetical protein A3K64_02585 [Candidatus Micrarchaeota archaeon RBG_16_36_9]
MSDFMPVLVIAIILFVILLIVFNGGIVSIPSRPSSLPPDETVNFGSFKVSYTASQVNAADTKGGITNGLFSQNDARIGFIASNPDQVSKSFVDLKVSNTNFYGKMVIFVNGNEIYSDYPPVGEVLIGFDPSVLKENNVLDVASESSGWKIWAPTVYDFELGVKLDYSNKRNKAFTFELSDLEKKYMTKARIVVFGNRQGVGNLVVTVNGVIVANSVTTLYQDFATSNLRTGNNTIEFYTEPNTTYDISSAQLIVFFQ